MFVKGHDSTDNENMDVSLSASLEETDATYCVGTEHLLGM